MNKKFFIFLLAVFYVFTLSAQRVISPFAGNFNNKQVLVLDTSDGAECYYSLSGTDPLVSGFTYDGPVLIDSIGRVNVKVTAVKGDTKEEIEINYNVQESNPFEKDSAEFNFIEKTVLPGVFTYSFDSEFNIPQTFFYSFGDGDKPFLKGKSLSLDVENRLIQYIPCNITDGKNNWRFVVFVTGGQIGALSKYSVPFEISDWNTLTFTGEKLIWCLDDEDWSASKIPVTLDRTKKHVVKWQSVAYKKGNPVQSFVIPPEPQLIVKQSPSGTVNFSIDGDLRYRMEIVSTGLQGNKDSGGGLFTTASFDTFEGNSVGGECVFAFYADGVFMGTKTVPFNIDKQPPVPPKFLSDAQGFYARSLVGLEIVCEKDCEVFYAVSSPLKISEELASSGVEPQSAEFNEVEAGNFKPYLEKIELASGTDSAVFYKVRAYSVDKNNNFSEVAEYRVVIDEYNYYLDSTASPAGADGSAKNPFTTFEQAVNVINSGRFAHFFVSGTFKIESKELILTSNSSFTARNKTEVILPPDGLIIVKNSGFEAVDIVFQKECNNDFGTNSRFFVFENSTANFSGCEVVGIFAQSGTVLDLSNSVLQFYNSGLTSQADSYTCGVSSLESKIYVKDSRISCIAQTAVDFSVNGGIFEMKNSSCRVNAHLGRIAELTGVTAKFNENSFTGKFDKKIRGIVPVWSDKNTVILENLKINVSGF